LKQNLKVFKADESSALNAHLDLLEQTKNHVEKHPVTYKKIRELLTHYKTIELTLERIYAQEPLSVTELFEVKSFAVMTIKLNQIIQEKSCFDAISLSSMKPVVSLLDPEEIGINSFYIYDGYSKTLKAIRDRLRQLETLISSDKKAKREELSKTYKIKVRPNGECTVKKHEKELLDILDNHDDFIYVSDTMMHRTYKVRISDEIKQHEAEMDRLRLEEEEEELAIRQLLTSQLGDYLDDLKHNISEIARMDLLLAKAYFAIAYQMSRPRIGTGCKIKNGIHLKVQEYLAKEDLKFMPISIDLDRGMTCITGANMGGKTICLRLLGQMQMMAQYGLFVPCESFEFELQSFIFLSSQDAQSIDKGLSTFGAEMVNVSKVLDLADKKGLILIDELARGTNPKEGYAISKAIINFLKKKLSVSVITTHFDGLADEEDVLHLQVKGLKDVDFEDLEINMTSIGLIHQLMDYRLEIINGPEAVPKDAIRISKVMGVDEKILEDARRILENREESWVN